MSTCRARFERNDTSLGTHTCDQPAGHISRGRPHHCPICNSWWRPKVGSIPLADPPTPPAAPSPAPAIPSRPTMRRAEL